MSVRTQQLRKFKFVRTTVLHHMHNCIDAAQARSNYCSELLFLFKKTVLRIATGYVLVRVQASFTVLLLLQLHPRFQNQFDAVLLVAEGTKQHGVTADLKSTVSVCLPYIIIFRKEQHHY